MPENIRNIDMFPEEITQLAQEINRHPNLKKILEANQHAGFSYLFGVVGEYCGMVLDGVYSHDDIVKLAGVMVEKLKDIGAIEVKEPGKIVVQDLTKSGIILPPGYGKGLH